MYAVLVLVSPKAPLKASSQCCELFLTFVENCDQKEHCRKGPGKWLFHQLRLTDKALSLLVFKDEYNTDGCFWKMPKESVTNTDC